MTFLFTSESVSEGHPDKVCDQISDAVLDAVLKQDPMGRVAAETFATTGLVLVGGEVRTSANIDIQTIVRTTLQEIGYTNPEFGIDANSCNVLSALHQQSQDISNGVDEDATREKKLGAGDQGMMFGYACRQTDVLMPLPIMLAHQLVQELARARKSNEISYIRPDAKAQVTVEYTNDNTPIRVHTVLISTQHHPDVSNAQIESDLIAKIIRKVIPSQYLDDATRYLINPSGRFVTGGPHGDAGLTGRKIIVDTYGGWAAHGGGAFSGKDSTKVDRSAAYMARYVAKNLVASGISDAIQVQLAYAIGVAEPLSIRAQSQGGAELPEEEIVGLIRKYFDLTPQGIIDTLQLRRPIFRQTAAYGHFGRKDIDLSWEKIDKAETLARAANLTASQVK
jgi:S-adenosylmethionine synthetase